MHQNEKPPAAIALSEATKLKNQLRDLANKAGETAYKRIGLARQLLGDRNWVAQEFPDGMGADGKATGGIHAALKTIEDQFFADLCGSVALATLLRMHELVAENVWKQHGWHLQRVRAEYEVLVKRDKPESMRNGPVARAEYDKVVEEKEMVRAALRTQEQESKRLGSEVQKLRAEVAEKNLEIAELKGRLAAMERWMNERNHPQLRV